MLARGSTTEAARASAFVTSDHKGSSPSTPALRLIGTATAATNRMECRFLDGLRGASIVVGASDTDLEPIGFVE